MPGIRATRPEEYRMKVPCPVCGEIVLFAGRHISPHASSGVACLGTGADAGAVMVEWEKQVSDPAMLSRICQVRKYFKDAARRFKLNKGRKKKIHKKAESIRGEKQSKVDAFYKSYEWKQARYKALCTSDGKCQCCGASKATGAVLNVDHIQSLRYNWKLRVDVSNLQVLCADCNWGKRNTNRQWKEKDTCRKE